MRWHVLEDTMTVSVAQLIALRTAEEKDGDSIAPNYRPIQTNVNTVYECN